jgi:hypothetical protein
MSSIRTICKCRCPPLMPTSFHSIYPLHSSYQQDYRDIATCTPHVALSSLSLWSELSRGHSPSAKFIVPDWGNKVDSGIGVSYRLARPHRLTTGLYSVRQPYTLCRSQLYPPVMDYDFAIYFFFFLLNHQQPDITS